MSKEHGWKLQQMRDDRMMHCGHVISHVITSCSLTQCPFCCHVMCHVICHLNISSHVISCSNVSFTAHRCVYRMEVAKFKESAYNALAVFVAIIRLPAVTTDLVVIFNVPIGNRRMQHATYGTFHVMSWHHMSVHVTCSVV